MTRINVTKSFLPPIEEYEVYLRQIWQQTQLTNQGPVLLDFETRAEKYLGVTNFHFVTNGTIALQLALRALDITGGEVITTPFSYVATTSAILWEHCNPVYVDIDPKNYCIDTEKIEDAITPNTKAIIAVHVFGVPCDTEKIEMIARRHNIKVIYDAAHAFGVRYKGKSLLDYGDVSTCSFHATKIFHTGEGGAVITRQKEVSDKVELIKRFGHEGDNHIMLGINAKASELNAAMGLCNLKYVDKVISNRKEVAKCYDKLLSGKYKTITSSDDTEQNYAYYPIVLENEEILLKVVDSLAKQDIFPRRYFYPSLNTLPYVPAGQKCPISEDISRRVLCLPIYFGLDEAVINKICKVLNR